MKQAEGEFFFFAGMKDFTKEIKVDTIEHKRKIFHLWRGPDAVCADHQREMLALIKAKRSALT